MYILKQLFSSVLVKVVDIYLHFVNNCSILFSPVGNSFSSPLAIFLIIKVTLHREKMAEQGIIDCLF